MMKFLGLILLILSTAFQGYSQTSDQEWPLFRGKPDLSGFTLSELPLSPSLVWSMPTGARTKSSPVVSGGMVIFGNDKGSVIAVSTDGKLKWKYEGGTAAEAPPMVYENKVII